MFVDKLRQVLSIYQTILHMAAITEQKPSEDIQPHLVNDDPKLAEIFPEELAGWHGWVNLQMVS